MVYINYIYTYYILYKKEKSRTTEALQQAKYYIRRIKRLELFGHVWRADRQVVKGALVNKINKK